MPPIPPEPDFTIPMSMADAKPWWQSATIISALTVVVSQAAALVGYTLDAGQLYDIATNAVGLVAGVIAILGRVRAIQPIGR